MKILGLDPGKNNFAFALVTAQGVEVTGRLPTVQVVRPGDLDVAIQRFTGALTPLIREADWVAFERMQSRPGFGAGAVVEVINLMIGAMCGVAVAHQTPLYPVAAVTWKTHWRKAYDLPRDRFAMATTKMSVPQPKGSTPKTRTELVEGVLGSVGCTIHEADAIGIAAYCWYREIGGDLLGVIKNTL